MNKALTVDSLELTNSFQDNIELWNQYDFSDISSKVQDILSSDFWINISMFFASKFINQWLVENSFKPLLVDCLLNNKDLEFNILYDIKYKEQLSSFLPNNTRWQMFKVLKKAECYYLAWRIKDIYNELQDALEYLRYLKESSKDPIYHETYNDFLEFIQKYAK